MSNDIRDELLDASEEALDGVIAGLRDGGMTDSEGRQVLVNLIASALDAIIPTGPIDPFDDQLIIEGTDRVLAAAEAAIGKAFRADPARIRERAAKAKAKGNDKRAARLESRALRVEARRAGG